jgi:hypothetical protein
VPQELQLRLQGINDNWTKVQAASQLGSAWCSLASPMNRNESMTASAMAAEGADRALRPSEELHPPRWRVCPMPCFSPTTTVRSDMSVPTSTCFTPAQTRRAVDLAVARSLAEALGGLVSAEEDFPCGVSVKLMLPMRPAGGA